MDKIVKGEKEEGEKKIVKKITFNYTHGYGGDDQIELIKHGFKAPYYISYDELCDLNVTKHYLQTIPDSFCFFIPEKQFVLIHNMITELNSMNFFFFKEIKTKDDLILNINALSFYDLVTLFEAIMFLFKEKMTIKPFDSNYSIEYNQDRFTFLIFLRVYVRFKVKSHTSFPHKHDFNL